MNKEELINLLKNHLENKAKLNIKLKDLKLARIELDHLKDTDNYETNITASYGENQDIHSKNQISNKILKIIEKKDIRRTELEEKISKLEEEVRELRTKVDIVEDRLKGLKYKEREILTAYYVEGRTAEDIGNKLYFQLFSQTRSDRHIQRIIDKATQKMLNL